MNTVSLVLGSGGARGLAHIDVIHWLEKNGNNIRSVAGTSIAELHLEDGRQQGFNRNVEFGP